MEEKKINVIVTDTLYKMVECVQVHKWKALSSLLSISLLAGGSFIGNQYYQSQLVDRYQVFYDGKFIGYVSSKEVVEEWLQKRLSEEEKAHDGVSLEVNNEITYKHEKVFKGEYNNANALAALENSVDVKANAYQLVVDGKVIGYVKSEAEGKALLEKVKSLYTKPFIVDKSKTNRVTAASVSSESSYQPAPNGEKLLDVSIKESVQFKPVTVDPEQITNGNDLYQILQKGTTKQKVYEVQKGDTLSEIAQKFGLKTSQLLQLNPSVKEDSLLQIGQKLNVTALDPVVTVMTVTEKTSNVEIPYKTTYIEDKNLYKGQTRVKQKGVPGQKEVTIQYKKENGVVIAQTEVDSNILKDPVDQIIIKGTKQPPVVATGRFAWPVHGGFITSGYGYRWGKLHPAIDISGTKDRVIMAADNGKVIEAGWDGNYGNNILISHGNGYVTRYAHLSKIEVKVGQKVAKGQEIGIMGETGNATGVHLHFEIIKNGTPVNPKKYF